MGIEAIHAVAGLNIRDYRPARMVESDAFRGTCRLNRTRYGKMLQRVGKWIFEGWMDSVPKTSTISADAEVEIIIEPDIAPLRVS